MVEAEQQEIDDELEEIDDELEEIKRLIDNKDAANTKRITKLAYNVFSSDKHVTRFFGIIYHL